MRTVQISNIHLEMLKEVAKRFKAKPDDALEILIQDAFNQKKRGR